MDSARPPGCAYIQSAIRINGDNLNAVPFELYDVVGVGYQPLVEEKGRPVPGLIQTCDEHADGELIDGDTFCRCHVRVMPNPQRPVLSAPRVWFLSCIYRSMS